MKIAFLATQWQSFWPGSEELWAEAARIALERGHEVTIVVFRWPEIPPKIRELQRLGAGLVMLARPADRQWQFPLLRRLRRPKFERFRVWARLAAWKPDVACINHGGTFDIGYDWACARFVHRNHIPYIVISQCNHEDMFESPEFVRRIADDFFRPARHIAFVSERNLRVTERQIAADLPNASVVLNPVNLRDLSPVPHPKSNVVKMANVARHHVAAKGQDVLLETLSAEHWRRRPWLLRLYGAGGDRPYLERLTEYYKLADKVEFRGHVGDIRSVWADNHLLVMPSRREGTPLALVEAMVCGRPSVVTDVGGNVEWIDEPSTGFVAEAPSVRSLDGALERAWDAREDWESIGQRAHELAVSRLASSPPGEAILSLLLDSPGSGAGGVERREKAVSTPG